MSTRGTGTGTRRGYNAPVQLDTNAVVARAMLGRQQLLGRQSELDARASTCASDVDLATIQLERLALAERLAAMEWVLGGALGTRITEDLERVTL